MVRPSRLAFVAVSILLMTDAGVVAQNRSVGGNFAYNEFSAMLRMPLEEKQSVRISANLDMTNVISGKNLYPGASVEVLYLFSFARKQFDSGECMLFYAGPGINAGYVRNFDGRYGVMAALSGHIGFEYVFNVPVSLSLSLEPALGIHVNRDRFGYVNTDLDRAGLAHSLLPHVGIMYHF